MPGAVDVRQMQVLDYPALRLDVDRLRAARLGLTQRDVATSVLISLASSAIISPSYFLNPNGVNYTVSVQTPIDRLATVDDLMATPITPVVSSVIVAGDSQDPRQAHQSPVITLGSLATVKPDTSYESVSHYTVQRVIDVAANVDGRDLGSTVRDIQAKLRQITADKDFPTDCEDHGARPVRGDAGVLPEPVPGGWCWRSSWSMRCWWCCSSPGSIRSSS